MPFIQRNDNNEIISIYARPQPGIIDEYLPEDNAEVVAYLTPPKSGLEAILPDNELTRSRLQKIKELNTFYKENSIRVFDFEVSSGFSLPVIIRDKSLNGMIRAINTLSFNTSEIATWEFDSEPKLMCKLSNDSSLTTEENAVIALEKLKELFELCSIKEQLLRSNRDSHRKNILNLTSIEDIESYDISTGW